jgi:2-polyprenyl-6-methoxyphenol hydroxylase-like FAD-dependent oxidoreductase
MRPVMKVHEPDPKPPRRLTTRCCIVGGGPAGMMLGYLLGRAGIDTLVLEKHADFLRDFRGDTVHPSTMMVMHELGLLPDFLERPHQKVDRLSGEFGGAMFRIADLTRVNAPAPYIAFMPQWEFLDFMAAQGSAFPSLAIMRNTEAVDLLRSEGRVTGVVARTHDGDIHIAADLTIGCDGRHSRLRDLAGLMVEDIGAPIDVLWFRIARTGAGDPAFLHAAMGRLMVTIDRGDYWQCAYIIAKGQVDALKARGLPAFRDAVVEMVPALADHIDDVTSWDDVKLLTVTIDRLRKWSTGGLLCIGDAAHAMSPVGGVGINLAIQDAVATANILADKLRRNAVTDDDLEAVRQRRLFPATVIQAAQVQIQNRIIRRALQAELRPPTIIRLLNTMPLLQRLFGRLIGMGIRPEHVRSPSGSALPEAP